MPKKIDLMGQTFGRLHVVKEDPIRRDSQVCWFCWCECEKDKPLEERILKSYKGRDLRKGITKSCGCYRKEFGAIIGRKPNPYKQDLTGQKFGKLIVLEDTGKRDSSRNTIWKCRCECGNICENPTRSLTSRQVSSCGCLRRSAGEMTIEQILNKNNFKYIQEKTFNTCIFPRTNRKLRFDFYINNQYLIEFDGKQHFTYNNSGWDNEEYYNRIQERDKFKNQWCIENKIPLIRIPYTHLDKICLEDLQLETSKFIVAGTRS